MKSKLFIVSVLAAGLAALAHADTLEVPYGSDPQQTGDLFLPAKVTPETPFVLNIHGGGWCAMSRKDAAGISAFLVENGCAVYSIDYRLASKENPWPACGDDCMKAAEFILRGGFAVQGLKPSRIWLIGASAGGHLALYTGLNLRTEQVAGIVSISGVADHVPDTKANPKRYARLFGGRQPTAPDFDSISIMKLVRKNGPRILLTHAKEDTVVPFESAANFCNAYRNAGNNILFYQYSAKDEANTGGHAIWRKNFPVRKRLLNCIENEIAQFMGISKSTGASENLTAVSKAKAWMKPENMRWANYQWENKAHFRRMGGPHVPFWCNSTFLDDYFDRLYCKETLQKFRDMGVTCIATSFYKGYGLEAEKEEIARQANVVRMAHEVGLKVLGYINSDACYYETLFKELPNAKKMLQRGFDGNWRAPDSSYYPHKAWLCVGYPGYLEWMKKVMARAFELGYDGISFDMAKQKTCFCEACTVQFREYLEKNITDKTRLGFTGFEHVEIPKILPVSEWDKKIGHVEMIVDPMAQEWIKFNAERFCRIRKEMYDFVKQFGEDKCVVINNNCSYVANGGDPLRFRHAGDCFYIESNFPYALKDGNIRTSVFNYKNIEAMGAIPIPTQWLMKDGRIALPEAPGHIFIGVFESAVYGGVPGNTWSSRVISGKTLHLDYTELTEAYAKAISFLDKHRDIYAGSKSLPVITILSTWEDFAYNRDTVIGHQALSTMMYTLQRANLPFRYQYIGDFDPKATDANLVILSDCHAISRSDAAKVIEHVKRGGCLLATGASGDYNENVLRYAENLFAELPGERYIHLAPAPEKSSTAELYPEVWGKHVTKYPDGWQKIVDGVRRLVGSALPYETECDDGVFIEPRVNAEGRLFLHVLNFWDDERRFAVTLKQGAPVKTFDLGDSAVEIDGRTVSGRVRNYIVIDCGHLTL